MFVSRRRLFVYITLLLSIVFTQTNIVIAQETPAEKLLTVMPDGVIGFYATSGGDSLEPAFEKSIMGRIWNDPGVQSFVQSIQKQLLTKLQQETGDPNSVNAAELVQNYVKLALSRPIIAGAAFKQTQDGPPLFGFAVLDAGSRKDEITSALTQLESMAGDEIVETMIGSVTMHGPKEAEDVPVYWGWVGSYLVLAINDGDGLAMKYLSAPRATPGGYLNNVKGSGDALAMHFDFQKIAGFVVGMAQHEGAGEELEFIKSVIKELGLSNVKTMTARVGFDGTDLVCSDFVEVSGPRTGLLANFKAVNPSMLDMVDAKAMSASLVNVDFAGMYDSIISAVKIAAPNDVYAEIQEGISEVESETKVQIRKELLESLAGPIIVYQIPMGVIMDLPTGGVVMVAELKDAALFEKSMSAIEQFVKTQDGEGMLQIGTQEQDGRTVHTWAIAPLAMMQVMPCWTVAGNKVVITSNLNLSNMAVAQISSGENSIRSTDGFKKVAGKLPDNILSIKYVDSKSQFKQMMMGLQQVWPMATMFAAKAGLTLPFVLPDLSKIAEDINPSCQYCWYDGNGYRSYYRGAGIEPSLAAVAGTAFGAGVLMPALARTRQVARRMVSGTNLSGIGKALLIYANDYDDQFPPDLQELIKKVELTPKHLESPRKPKDFDGPSYIYITGQNTSMYPGNIVVYENPEFSSEGLNVLFLDTHVEWMKKDDFMRELKETYERLGREMPEIKFKD